MSRRRQRLGLHSRNEQGRLPPASCWGGNDAICEADRPCVGTCERYVPPFEFTERYLVEARIQRALSMIANLRVHVDRHKDAELAHALAGLEHLAPGDREAVALLANPLINGMFYHLAARLKAVASAPDAGTHLAALAFLFDDTGTDER